MKRTLKIFRCRIGQWVHSLKVQLSGLPDPVWWLKDDKEITHYFAFSLYLAKHPVYTGHILGLIVGPAHIRVFSFRLLTLAETTSTPEHCS